MSFTSESIIGGYSSKDQEEVIKSGEKEKEQEDNDENDELWSDDEYGSEGLDEHNDVVEVSYDDIQAGGGSNALAAAAAASKDETASQLSPYCYDNNHSEEYFQQSSKRRTSVIVDLTLDGDESDCTKPPLTPSQQSVRLKYPVNVTGPSQTESIGDFSEDDDHLRQVPGRPNT